MRQVDLYFNEVIKFNFTYFWKQIYSASDKIWEGIKCKLLLNTIKVNKLFLCELFDSSWAPNFIALITNFDTLFLVYNDS